MNVTISFYDEESLLVFERAFKDRQKITLPEEKKFLVKATELIKDALADSETRVVIDKYGIFTLKIPYTVEFAKSTLSTKKSDSPSINGLKFRAKLKDSGFVDINPFYIGNNGK